MCYIKYGWDKLLVDPDNGENCHRKLAATYIPGSVSGKLFQSVPSVEDTQWTTRLYNIPKITFSTIYDYLKPSYFSGTLILARGLVIAKFNTC